jgi:7-cyano-7-deazaguanine synthase
MTTVDESGDSPDFHESALVLFSGGQDSTTCLAWALSRYRSVETVGFDYRQRHRVELVCRQPILDALKCLKDEWAQRLGQDHLLDLGVLASISDSALTSEAEIRLGAAGLPTTFVPGRNLLFLTLAAAIAYRRGIGRIVAGVCETDYSGYPDCRDDTIKAQQVALNLGMESRFVLETPLMWIDKAATWALAHKLGGAELERIIIELTHTCYHGDRTTRHDWGYGCGVCPACGLRRAGYEKFKLA